MMITMSNSSTLSERYMGVWTQSELAIFSSGIVQVRLGERNGLWGEASLRRLREILLERLYSTTRACIYD